MKKSSWALLVALVALIIAITSFFVTSGGASHPAGSTAGKTSTSGFYIAGLGFAVGTEQSAKTVFNSSGQLTLSSVGTAVTGLNFGTCFIKAYATTIAASSTGQVDCQATAIPIAGPGTALAGITYGDKIVATLATSTAGTLSEGLDINAVAASSTAGWITLIIANNTGGTFTWPITGSATGTANYIALR